MSIGGIWTLYCCRATPDALALFISWNTRDLKAWFWQRILRLLLAGTDIFSSTDLIVLIRHYEDYYPRNSYSPAKIKHQFLIYSTLNKHTKRFVKSSSMPLFNYLLSSLFRHAVAVLLWVDLILLFNTDLLNWYLLLKPSRKRIPITDSWMKSPF